MTKIFFAFILFVSISSIYGQTTTTGRPQSDCERDRTRAQQRNTSPINLIPVCKPNGEYSDLQCHSNSTWCQCWKTNGTPVSQPSRKIKRCECILHRHTQQSAGGPSNPNGLLGAYIPQCADNGGYQKVQCHGSIGMCWCVDDTGAQVGDKVRGTPTCT